MNNKIMGFFAIAVALILCGSVIALSSTEDVDAATTYGSEDSPLDSLSVYNSDLMGHTYYVDMGGSVSTTVDSTYIVSVSSGYGLSVSSYAISGTLTAAGTITVKILGEDDAYYYGYIVSVDTSEDDLEITSAASISGISGSTISYTAETNITATFTESSGTAASWLSITSAGYVSGTLPSVTATTSYTYVILATSSTDSTNTATQTITITVYPIAQISATSTSISTYEGQTVSVTLSSNVALTYSVASGTLPSGLSLSTSESTTTLTVSGTLSSTSSGTYTVKIQGVQTSGVSQTATITLTFSIEEAATIAIGDYDDAYTAGDTVVIYYETSLSNYTLTISSDAPDGVTDMGGYVIYYVTPGLYSEVTTISFALTVSGDVSGNTNTSATITFTVEPVLEFTTLPTAACVILPVVTYNSDGSIDSVSSDVSADDIAVDYTFEDTCTIKAVFTGTDAESIYWDWGDGSSSTGSVATHTYTEAGTYTITLTAVNSAGESVVTLTIQVGSSSSSDAITLCLIIAVVVLLIACIVLIARR